jgi:polar amino acid transport system substrate-binding protein
MKLRYLLLILSISACTPQPEKAAKDTSSTDSIQPDLVVVAEQLATLDDCNLILGFDAWEPYQYSDVGGRVAGLDIELVTGVAESIGCNITYQQGTWVDLLSLLKQGNIDMLLGASKTEAREEFAFFSDAYRMEEFSLYIRSGDEERAAYTTLSEFIENGNRIGVVSDYLYGEEVAVLLDDPEKSQYFVNAIMGELNIARLLDQDIAGFLEDSFVGASMLRRKALSDLIVAQGITIETGNVYVMFSQQSITQDQLAKFNAQLQKVKQSQLYEDLLKKYSY